MNELEQKIYDGILKKINLDGVDTSNIHADTLLFSRDAGSGEECLELDSIDAMEMIVLIYEKWGIDVPAEDMPKLRTIRCIAEYITEHKG